MPSLEELQAQIEALKAENARLTAPKDLSLKVSDKGAVSVYGLGRFPVTLYLSQWERLIGSIPKVQEFIEANRAKLKTKGE
jgi:hypothetical protein